MTMTRVRTALRYGWPLLYAAIIVACVLLAPDEQIRFIYTEF